MSIIKGPCMNCMEENPLFLHYLYENNTDLQFCTSCLLASFPGAYCPICFRIFESEHFNSCTKPFKCSTCPAIAHFSCVFNLSARTSKSAVASSIPPARYVCPPCSDPNFRFFNYERDEQTQTARLDEHLCKELRAASIISSRCMIEAKDWWNLQVEKLAKEAAEARKKATQALERLAELNKASQVGQNEDENNIIIGSSDEDSSEDIDSDESFKFGNGSNKKGNNINDESDVEIYCEATSDEEGDDEESD